MENEMKEQPTIAKCKVQKKRDGKSVYLKITVNGVELFTTSVTLNNEVEGDYITVTMPVDFVEY